MSGTPNGSEQQLALPMARAGGGGVVDKGADFANYFCTYAFLYHQKEMLSDRVRMDAYYTAIFENKHHFEGKTVLDVGTGSGILAIWCAQAGARKVYAVEATKMAEHARQLAVGNGVSHIVDVIAGSMEDVILPEKVDVIISEWMGYYLLRESMFDSLICARDRWLKPSGVIDKRVVCIAWTEVATCVKFEGTLFVVCKVWKFEGSHLTGVCLARFRGSKKHQRAGIFMQFFFKVPECTEVSLTEFQEHVCKTVASFSVRGFWFLCEFVSFTVKFKGFL